MLGWIKKTSSVTKLALTIGFVVILVFIAIKLIPAFESIKYDLDDINYVTKKFDNIIIYIFISNCLSSK